ncbi:MAG: dTMP kinase [Gammaproteobacteria bacterium]|nr:dTMP kinase [Gammaproteobacteria bacterium]
MKVKGKFITIEGGEGAGKSTNLIFIRQYLKAAEKKVVLTREPGGTSVGEKIRDVLLDKKQIDISNDTELLMMFAARAQHIEHVILPALNAGDWVLCDRFTDATYAYQGGGRGIDNERIATLENWVQGTLRPDLTLLLDLPVEEGMKRANKRSEPDRFEQEKLEFFNRVRNAYLNMARTNTGRYRIVDASTSLENVQEQITQILDEFCVDNIL